MSTVTASSPLRKRHGNLVRQRRGHFVSGTTRLTGITRLLQVECYPRHEYDAANLGEFDMDEEKSTEAVGQEIGRLVDRQITVVVRLMWTYGLKWKYIPGATTVTACARFPSIMSNGDKRRLEKVWNHAHAFTREFFRQLKFHRMLPVQSQVPVGSEILHLGTAVDVIATSSRNVRRSHTSNSYMLVPGARVSLLEVKCGFQRTYRRHTREGMNLVSTASVPMPTWTDAAYYQHQLQLGVTVALFKRTYLNPQSKAYVVRLFQVRGCTRALRSMGAQGGAKWYPLDHTAMATVMPCLLLRLARRAFNEHRNT